jgi:hypothetical protein
MIPLKLFLVWIGVHCLNLRLESGVRIIDWMFSLSLTLRAA